MSDLDVARDDLALDALAAGTLPDGFGGDAAVGLLHALRTDLDDVVSPEPGVAPVVPLRPRRRRSATVIALAAAAGIVVGGVAGGAVVVADRPGELLYAAHSAILGAEDHTAAQVTALLDDASGALARGDRATARRLLARATALIASVPDAGDRTALRTRAATLMGYAVEPTPSPDRHGGEGPSASRTPEPADDHGGSSGSGSDDSGSGSGTSGSGSGTSGGSGSDDSTSGGSGSSGSGTSGSGTSGSGSGGSGSGGSGTSGSGTSGDDSPDDHGGLATPTVDSGGHGSGGGDDGGSH
jgi:hypothetical protein